jgi:homoserine kinase
MKLIAFAPISVANFIVGFDTLGAALANVDGELLGDIVTLETNEHFSFYVTGLYAHKLPTSLNNNLIKLCCDAFHKRLKEKNMHIKKFSLCLEKRLPISTGLGSSASSIVATLLVLNEFYENIFTKNELLILAGEMEGIVSGTIHYDNVAPSLLGGLQLMIPNKNLVSEALPFFDDWFFIIHYPGIEISTSYAREILPHKFDLPTVTVYWQKLAGFIHGIYQNDKNLVISLLHDNLIEPHRSKLVPGFEKARAAALDAGALAFGLSGSGPTCLAITESLANAIHIQTAIKNVMPKNSESFGWVCTLDKQGARLLKDS